MVPTTCRASLCAASSSRLRMLVSPPRKLRTPPPGTPLLVMLKNGKSTNKPVVPLPKHAPKILVAGTHADDIGKQCGWTLQWQRQSGNITSCTTILSAIKSTVYSKTEVVYSENPDSGFVKPRHVTMSWWDKRRLRLEQVRYACLDAFVSFEIGRVLMNGVIEES